MAQNLLAALAFAGVLERPGRRQHLRISPRFLAHAEGTAARMRLLGADDRPCAILEAALRTWDEYHHDAHAGARFVQDVLESHDQYGALRPVFPALEQFAVAA